MNEVRRGYTTAITAGPEHGDHGLIDGLRWLTSTARTLGGTPLVFVPQMSILHENRQLAAYAKRPGIAVTNWRSGISHRGGPVLAAWPDRVKLGEIPDHHGTRALCVIPWSAGETDAWQRATKPQLLGPATAIALGPVPVRSSFRRC